MANPTVIKLLADNRIERDAALRQAVVELAGTNGFCRKAVLHRARELCPHLPTHDNWLSREVGTFTGLLSGVIADLRDGVK
jgi:hypothetical protein